MELQFLFSTHRLIILYICCKFRENKFSVFGVMERQILSFQALTLIEEEDKKTKMAELLPLKAYPLTLNIQGTIYNPGALDQIFFTKNGSNVNVYTMSKLNKALVKPNIYHQ